jgi:glycolate oxidase FAD binding subunit
LWRAIRDVTPFAAEGPAGGRVVWRISTAPSRGTELGRPLLERVRAELLYDWAGGLVWAALPPSDDADASVVRSIVAGVAGHATLIRAPAATRAKIDVFSPEPAPLAALTRRVRESFDPQGVLNAGRMWAGV